MCKDDGGKVQNAIEMVIISSVIIVEVGDSQGEGEMYGCRQITLTSERQCEVEERY